MRVLILFMYRCLLFLQYEPEVEKEAAQPKLSVQLGSFKSHPAGAPHTQGHQ